MLNRQPYTGFSRKLILAFDVGTTFSGVSYCILDPGEIPVIRGVTRYPAQDGGASKIPSVIYYDQSGSVQSVGAETDGEEVKAEAMENDWTKAEWFKLHLRPKKTSNVFVTKKIPPLPKGKTAVDVLADFLRYLYTCTRTYIEQTHANGRHIWKSVEKDTEFVLSHPNGWEGGQQALMREAAIKAGLITDVAGAQSRLSFVTEGEASLHYCVQSGLITEAMKEGKGILILDAGGGTIDISSYKKTSPNSQYYEEIAPPQCEFKGSIFVTRNAQEYLEVLLKRSKFVDDIPHIVEQFDKSTKLRFVNRNEAHYIKFGRVTDKAPELNINFGQLRLLGSEVAKFFEPSVSAIIRMVEDECKASKTEISSVFLVGGFGSSNWLFNNLRDTFAPRGLDVCRPDGHLNKAVADGAVSYHIDHFVRSRVAKYSYGICAHGRYDPSDPEHIIRRDSVFTSLTGEERIQDRFSIILPKDAVVSETKEFRKSYYRENKQAYNLNNLRQSIKCFRGSRPDPRWLDEERKMYSDLCTVEADLTHIPKPANDVNRLGQDPYYTINFDIILSLGLTEFKAFVAWEENGEEKRSPAQMVYDPDQVIFDSIREREDGAEYGAPDGADISSQDEVGNISQDGAAPHEKREKQWLGSLLGRFAKPNFK